MDESDKQNDLKKSQNEFPSQPSKVEIITNLFAPFSEKEESKEFNIMKEDLIAYVTLQENNENIKKNQTDEWTFKNLLYSSLEKNLIEVMYINNKDFRKEKIIKVFNWYQNQLKTFKDLRFINHKSYNDLDAVQDEVYFKEKLDLIKNEADHRIEDDILKEQMTHRSAIFDKSLLDEFKRNHVYENVYYKKLNKQLDKKLGRKTRKKDLKPDLEKPDRPVGSHTIYYIYKDGQRPLSISKTNLNEKKILALPAGGERQQTFHTKLGEKKYVEVNIDKEIKSTYSYYRPNMDFNILNAEKKIVEEKNKFLNQKRSEEEINKNVKDFGIMRARYKADEEKKCTLKKLVSIYTNRKKLDTPLLAKYRKNNMINATPLVSEEQNKNINFSSINRLSTSSIKYLPQFKMNKENKLDKKFYSPNNEELEEKYYYLSPQEEEQKRKEDELKRKEEEKENLSLRRKMQKKYTYSRIEVAKKFRRIHGDKIIINEAKNVDKSTKEIVNNSPEKIPNINLNLKFQKNISNQKLIQDRLNPGEEEDKKDKKFPNDIIYKLIIDEPTFRQKLIYKNLCKLRSNNNEYKIQNETFSEDESIYNNFCLSAYNIKNHKFMEKFSKKVDSDVKIMRHISSYTKFNDKKKLLNRNESFDNFRYNYLNLRKAIGEFKKYEYQEIISRLSKKKETNEDVRSTIRIKDKDPFLKKISSVKYRKQKVLSSALMNPDEENVYPRLFFPRTANSLISKNEPPAAKKKKGRRRR